MNLPVLIPAFNPNESLLNVVQSLVEEGVQHIIVVNDGSELQYEPVFIVLENIKECHLLRHAVNLGKGRAIKTGLNYYYLNFPDMPGIITADADGQHLVQDIIRVGNALFDDPNTFIIGTRTFGSETPLRSLIGNVVTKYIFRLVTGIRLSDTQSGLRCIPKIMVPGLLELEGERYEYELNMLIATKKNHIGLREQKIATVYVEGNKSSHFNPLIDSMKIYFMLLRFSFSSIITSVVDFIWRIP